MKYPSARAKFERAREHKDLLYATAMEWVRTEWHSPALPIDKRVETVDGGFEAIIWAVGKPTWELPEKYALILGDALFNYHAALDHLAWQLVSSIEAPRRPEVVYFPIVSVRSKFADTANRKLPGVPDLVKSVIKQHQPFQNGSQWAEHPLMLLHEWNSMDKHRVVPLVATNAMKIDITVPNSFDNFVAISAEQAKNTGHLLPGTDLLRVIGRRRNAAKDHGVQAIFKGEMAFAYPDGRSIEAYLDLIDRKVDAVLTDFERLS